MDLLLALYNAGKMSEEECDQFIKEVKNKGSKLINGVDTIEDYKRKKITAPF